MNFITAMQNSPIQLQNMKFTLKTQRGKPYPTVQKRGITGLLVSNSVLHKGAEISQSSFPATKKLLCSQHINTSSEGKEKKSGFRHVVE
jgi:hypothetical protein